MCQNLPIIMTIFTMNTNIEMARSDGCQNLILLDNHGDAANLMINRTEGLLITDSHYQ